MDTPVKPTGRMGGRTQPKLRRSPLVVAAGVVLVVGGALASAGVYTHLSNAQEVIAVVGAVERGEIIERADIAVARVGLDPLLTPLPAAAIDDVVGQYALSDLVVGTFLTADSIGHKVTPSSGHAEIGLSLGPGEYAEGIKVGDHVLLVSVRDRTGTVDQEVTQMEERGSEGTVVAVSTPDSNRVTHFSVEVLDSAAPGLAALSASDRLALVLLSREKP